MNIYEGIKSVGQAGAPVQLVADGEFVAGHNPLPVQAQAEADLIVLRVPEVLVIEPGTSGRLFFNRFDPGLSTHRFAAQLPRVGGRIEHTSVMVSALLAPNALTQAVKNRWRDARGIYVVSVLETPYKTYQQAINAGDADTVNLSYVVGVGAWSCDFQDGFYQNSTERLLLLLQGGGGSASYALPPTTLNRFVELSFYTTVAPPSVGANFAVYVAIGWSRRYIRFANDLASGTDNLASGDENLAPGAG